MSVSPVIRTIVFVPRRVDEVGSAADANTAQRRNQE